MVLVRGEAAYCIDVNIKRKNTYLTVSRPQRKEGFGPHSVVPSKLSQWHKGLTRGCTYLPLSSATCWGHFRSIAIAIKCSMVTQMMSLGKYYFLWSVITPDVTCMSVFWFLFNNDSNCFSSFCLTLPSNFWSFLGTGQEGRFTLLRWQGSSQWIPRQGHEVGDIKTGRKLTAEPKEKPKYTKGPCSNFGSLSSQVWLKRIYTGFWILFLNFLLWRQITYGVKQMTDGLNVVNVQRWMNVERVYLGWVSSRKW